MTTPAMFARTVQQTEEWLAELVGSAQIEGKQQAYAALRAVLHHLRDRLTVEEAAHLGAQLPTLVRGVYYEHFKPADMPNKDRHEVQFAARVGEELHMHPEIDADAACRAVFELLAKHLDTGEIRHVVQMMPSDVKAMWPEAA
jgi:uncharacterized protein (DUF2267 family)